MATLSPARSGSLAAAAAAGDEAAALAGEGALHARLLELEANAHREYEAYAGELMLHLFSSVLA